ncbi:hypothetical protein QZH41_011256 [Actinostola sp. cb2023]|nr:hypothetical protein QZH41_011256 [Actinostola sp. cb2023]
MMFGSRSRFKLTSHRIGIILITMSFLWGLYLVKIQLDERSSQPDYLRLQIIQLSKEYIQALARAKSLESIDGQMSAGELSFPCRKLEIFNNGKPVLLNSTKNKCYISHNLDYTDSCDVPNDPNYPECAKNVKFLQAQWRSDPKYAKHGVNGSVCSILNYLSKIEAWCPKRTPNLNCAIPHDSAFPHCSAKVQWMRTFWASDPKFKGNGVDGSDCSILFYLSEVESWCPFVSGRHFKSDCEIPNSPSYPSCMTKVAWMRNFWKSDSCYTKDHGVNGTICSFLVYLSEVESWCPILPGRRRPTAEKTLLKNKPVSCFWQDFERKDVEKLFALMYDRNAVKFKWIKTRIQRMWPDWLEAANAFKSSRNISNAVQKRILVHIGVLASESSLHFAANADKGGPLGELIQWSDLISSLYILGHDITVTADIGRLQQALGKAGSRRKACPTKVSDDFDLVYLDYYGIRQIITKIGQLMPHFKCKFRILDSFGTEAQFNYAGFTEKIPGGSMGIWGRHNLDLRQFMTMFPHSPDNSFLGFVVGKTPASQSPPKKKKPRALVYGKHYFMWKDLKNKQFLDVVNKYLEIHATVGGAPEAELQKYIPKYVINHGVLPAAEIEKLLHDTMVFVGLGFPYEGPAPLEAIANGCFYLNPKYDPPRNRINTPFFKDKPTLRKITSQHPYTEEYISKPYVFTVNIDNNNDVDAVMQKIMVSEPVQPYLPFEFTHQGMLERLHEFIQRQDVCEGIHWPPANVVKPVRGQTTKSCKETCHENGMVCEPQLFREVNTVEQLTRAGYPCNITRSEEMPSLIAPGYRIEPPVCLIQAQSLLYSCTASSPSTKRLCPCREFKIGQVALCKTC